MFETILKELMSQLGGTWKPFTYTTGLIALDNATKITVKFNVGLVDQNPFIWTHGLFGADLAAVAAGTDTFFGGALVKLDEVSGQGTGGNDAFQIGSLFGRDGVGGSGPRRVPWPMIFRGSSNIIGSLTNLTGGAINYRLDFIGLKRF